MDDEILKANTIDFTAFSYYFSQVSTTQQGWEKTSGNLFMANKKYHKHHCHACALHSFPKKRRQ